MADNVAITAGSGTNVATDDVGGVHFQKVKLDVGGDGATVPATGDGTYGLDVDVTRVSGNVTVVQGTPGNLKVDASGVPVPVTDNAASLTVDAPVGTPVYVRLSDGSSAIAALPVTDNAGTLSVDDGGGSLTVDGTVAISGTVPVSDAGGSLTVDDGGGSLTVDGTVSATVSDGGGSITVDDGGLTVSVDDGGGSLTVDGAVTSNQGTPAAAANAWPVKIGDGTNAATLTNVSAKYGVDVNIIGGTGLGAQADKSGFVEGTGQAAVVAGVRNDTISSDPSEDQAAALRITSKRGLHVNLRDASGVELATSSNPAGANIVQVAGNAIATAAAGIPKAGIVDGSGTNFGVVNALPVTPTPPINTQWRGHTTYSASQSDIALLTPTSGNRWFVTMIIITVQTSGVLAIYDEANVASNILYKGTPAAGAVIVIPYPTPWKSASINRVLRYSTGSGATGDIVFHAWENNA